MHMNQLFHDWESHLHWNGGLYHHDLVELDLMCLADLDIHVAVYRTLPLQLVVRYRGCRRITEK